MVQLDHVTFGYALWKPILRDVSLHIERGARICLTGVSGKGKTTVLRLIMGLEKPRKGTVLLEEGTRISAVFQEDRLLPHKTVLENVALFSDETTASKKLCKLGMGDVLSAYPNELSGGMKRRVALARALCHEFDLLILDEPLTGLDADSKSVCLAAINEAVGNRTLLLVSHDVGEAAALGATCISL